MTAPTIEGPSPQGPYTAFDRSELPVTRTVSAKATAASVQLMTGPGLITLIDANETTGAAAFLAYVHDGTDATGPILAALGSGSAGSEVISPALAGITFRIGLWVERVSGTFTVVITYVPLREQPPG